jgi:hypothetical protein
LRRGISAGELDAFERVLDRLAANVAPAEGDRPADQRPAD